MFESNTDTKSQYVKINVGDTEGPPISNCYKIDINRYFLICQNRPQYHISIDV